MNELLRNYNAYGNFLRENFFVQNFDQIPSKYFLELPLETSQENIKQLLDKLDTDTYQLKLVYKTWITNPSRTPKASEDFPTQYFYQSKTAGLCVWLSLEHERLFIELLYDHTIPTIEAWVRAFCHDIRDSFDKKKEPVFKVLSKSGGDYYTEEIAINASDLKINDLYNDDFLPIHEVIHEALSTDSSGLILLHGPPGTGKTSYIKSLLSSHDRQDFIFIPNDFVQELLQPGFISFLIGNKNAVLVIEDAEKVIISRETNGSNSVVSTILQLTDGLFSDYLNIKIICTFNTSIDRVDQALLRKGRMIAFYEFQALQAQKANELVQSLGHEALDQDMTLAEIFNLEKITFDEGKKNNAIGFRKS